MTRKIYSGHTKGYAGRGEDNDAPLSQNLRKLPVLRAQLKVAASQGRLPAIAEEAGCSTQDLKPFMNGAVSKLGGGIRSRLIAVLAPDR